MVEYLYHDQISQLLNEHQASLPPLEPTRGRNPFGFGLPHLIFREPQTSDGVFDNGVTDVFIHKMPCGNLSATDRARLKEVILKWCAKTSARLLRCLPPWRRQLVSGNRKMPGKETTVAF